MIWYTIYTRKDPPCKFCRDAKDLLDLHGIDYKEIDIDEPGIRDLMKERGLKTVPQVYRETQHIGGFLALENHLKEMKLDEEKKYRRKGRKDEYHSA